MKVPVSNGVNGRILPEPYKRVNKGAEGAKLKAATTVAALGARDLPDGSLLIIEIGLWSRLSQRAGEAPAFAHGSRSRFRPVGWTEDD